ncbi:MAG: carboxypeptidase regulatory-like domain-containing protein [Acidobacteria bacterium]|nr:carboxypeptidase regulatory-like domain-containing protein [Acidobacteriota bacterium]
MKKLLFALIILPIFFAMPRLLQAQSTGAMTGNVVDATGSAVPDTTVVLSNKTRGLSFTQTTNGSGTYLFSEIPPGGGYEATFTHAGFAPFTVQNIYLTVATTRTQNAQLKAGTTQEVQVTASNSEVTINTTDASIGNTFDVKLLNQLPVQQRDGPTALFTLQPGVSDTGSTTGARVDQNYITLDGLDVNDFATGGATQSNAGIQSGFSSGSIVGGAPIDSIDEFHATVGGYTPSTGLGSGGQFQLVTKSGTNQFHGNINEYHRDPSLVANSWFSNNASPVIPRNHLIQNQFGGNLGGPILKDKLFFFFDYNQSRIIRSALANRIVPLDSFRNGNINYLNQAGGISSLTPAQVQNLDPAKIGEDGNFFTFINSRYPHANQLSQGDGINSGGYNFNAPDNSTETNYVGRFDYNLTAKQKLFARATVIRENGTNVLNAFGGDPATNPVVDRSYAFVVGHTWQIGSNKFNQLYLGETVQNLSFPDTYNPLGTTSFTFGDGTQAALASAPYNPPSSQARRIPIAQIGDNFTWTKGNHNIQFGGDFEDIRAHNQNTIDYNAVEIGLGGQTLNLNPSLRPADINTSATNANTANQTYDQAFAFSLARIANVQSDYNYNVSGTALPQLSGDTRVYQNYQTELYVSDTWKLTPELTLTYGLNYQLFSVPYETRGLESTINTTFNQYLAARVAQSAAGQTGASAVPLISYVLGGKANNGPDLFKPQYLNFAPRFAFAFNPSWDRKAVFNGSAAVVYDRTVVNAIEQIQDSYSYLFQQTATTAEGISGDPYTSLLKDPRLDANNGISRVPLSPPATPKAPYQPFTNNGVPYGLQSGGAFNTSIDPALKTPYSIAYNLGMQRSFAGDLVMKLNYTGRLGRRLLAQADANQILDFPDKASGQFLSSAFATITQALRAGADPTTLAAQPWFEHVMTPGYGAAHPSTDSNGNITQTYANNTQYLATNYGGLVRNGDFGDFVQALSNFTPLNVGSAAQFSENGFYTNQGFSSYNALLASLQKNFSHGLQFDVNYTFAHSIDNVSLFANGQGDTGIGGVGLICDVIRPRECRANSDFDITNYVTADFTYQLPFGKGRQFLSNASWLENEIIGGWDISGITDFHTGQAWGTASNAFDASYSNDAPGILVGSPAAVVTNLQKLPGGGVNIFGNSAAARAAYTGPVGFQIGSRNSLRGPRFFNQDAGLAKAFPIHDTLNLQFRADAFNVLNHPNFGLPQSNSYNGYDQQDVTSTTFGQISSTVEPAGNLNNGARVLQLSLRLDF